MLEFLTNHVQVVNAVLNAIMVLIWTAHLHTFLSSHLRQSKSVIHIDIGAAKGAQSRCLVTNLSSNPIYIQGLVADLARNGQSSRTIVTDRNEISKDDVQDPLAGTNRGTLQPGGTIDIGSLYDLVSRARISLDEDWSTDRIDSVTLTVVAIPGHVDRVVGASKTFDAVERNGQIAFSAKKILTHQLRPYLTRNEFSHILRDQTQE